MKFVDKDLKAIQEARVLMEEAAEAVKILSYFNSEQLDAIVCEMLDTVQPHLAHLTQAAAEETGFGCPEDDARMCGLLVKRMKETYAELHCVGVLSQDENKGLIEIGVPMGIVAAVVPAVNTVSAVICAAAAAIKAGNAIVFSPNPKAARVTWQTVQILNSAAEEAGLPEGALACMETAAVEGAMQLFAHSDAAVILNIGEPELLKAAAGSGKPVLFGGITPGPAFIERTANVAQAAENVVESRSFNYGIGAGSEQFLVVEKEIAQQVREEMTRRGAYFMNAEEQKKLTKLLGLDVPFGKPDEAYLGKSAKWLSGKAGFWVPEGTKLLVSEQEYITDYNAYARGLMCPVMVFYIEQDWIHACEKCIEILLGESNGNTLTIHSGDPKIIQRFAMEKPVGRVLINTPAVMGAMGLTTELCPSAGMGSMTAGQGITADNISPLNLIYRRKAAFGMRNIPTE